MAVIDDEHNMSRVVTDVKYLIHYKVIKPFLCTVKVRKSLTLDLYNVTVKCPKLLIKYLRFQLLPPDAGKYQGSSTTCSKSNNYYLLFSVRLNRFCVMFLFFPNLLVSLDNFMKS